MSDTPIPERHRSMPENPAEISNLSGVLSEDQSRVVVTIELSNGSTHPDLDLTLFDADHSTLSHTTILENIGPRLVFTMHTRQTSVKFPLKVHCALTYLENQIFSEKEISIESK
jgi:hypothetical protein